MTTRVISWHALGRGRLLLVSSHSSHAKPPKTNIPNRIRHQLPHRRLFSTTTTTNNNNNNSNSNNNNNNRHLRSIPQRSEAWFKARESLVTASEASAFLTRTPEMVRPFAETFQLSQDAFEQLADSGCANPYGSDRDILLRKLEASINSNNNNNNNSNVTIVEDIHVKCGDEAGWQDFESKLGQLTDSGPGFGALLSELRETFHHLEGTLVYCPNGSVATKWGTRYEPVARNIYSKIYGIDIEEESLVVHDRYTFLGASPDGISVDGSKLVEIKCPFKGSFSGINVLYSYWIQTQLQMEVMNVDECDLFECIIWESPVPIHPTPANLPKYNNAILSQFSTDVKFQPQLGISSKRKVPRKGIMVQLDSTRDHLFLVPPAHLIDVEDFLVWIRQVTAKDVLKRVQLIQWNLVNFRNTTIPRDREWFQMVRPVLEAAADRLQTLKTQFRR